MAREKAKNLFTANLAFWLSMGFWIPLFNIGFAAVAIWQGVKAVRLADADPKSFGGRGRALAAVIIGITTLVLTFIGIILYSIRFMTCGPIELANSLI